MMKEINTVEEYYSYESQGHCFAPSFNELNRECKQYWEDRFIEYKSKQAKINKVK